MFSPNLIIFIYENVYLLTTHCARPSLIGPLELADIVTHISQSVSVLNITPYGNIHEHQQTL